jgi:hypothetical protein
MVVPVAGGAWAFSLFYILKMGWGRWQEQILEMGA